MKVCLRCRVTGRVQGVFFRGATRQQAQTLGVTGYARNLPDGAVEVLACGESDAVADLCGWLQVGPPAAAVQSVECAPANLTPPSGFTTA